MEIQVAITCQVYRAQAFTIQALRFAEAGQETVNSVAEAFAHEPDHAE
jgi:hypothetical protein